MDFNSLRPRHNGRHFPDDIFKCIFLNESIWISFEISLKFVPKGPINNIPALVQIMAWRRPGDKPFSETMLVCLLTNICVTRPQWVNVPGRDHQWVPFTKVSNADHWCVFDVRPIKLLKHSCDRCFQTPWHSCDVSVMIWTRDSLQNVENMFNLVSILTYNGLAPSGARASAGIVMVKFGRGPTVGG